MFRENMRKYAYIMQNQATSERIKLFFQPAINMTIKPAMIVNFPRESIPYLPYIKRISFSFKIITFLIYLQSYAIAPISQ